jgi:hypothetical protein
MHRDPSGYNEEQINMVRIFGVRAVVNRALLASKPQGALIRFTTAQGNGLLQSVKVRDSPILLDAED